MYDFDRPFIDNPKWDGKKWRNCTNGEIPMFVAVMDFMIPPPILDAIYDRLKFPSFGYDNALCVLNTLCSHYKKLYNCEVKPEWLLHVLSVMPGINVGVRVAGGTIMYCTPIYTHIRKTPQETGLPAIEVPMKLTNGTYYFDFEAMERAYTPNIKSFILCNPHNPIGRVYTKKELIKLVRWCQAHDMIIVSDEIHCELVFEGKHVPLFSCCEEAKKMTITVSSPNKICNMPRIPMGYVIIPDDDLRERFFAETHACFGRGEAINSVAFQAAYDGSCDVWKRELIDYLLENRNYMEQRISDIPELSVTHNEGTYLAWVDCSKLNLDEPNKFFLDNARVIMSSGAEFGDKQCVRLNFGCPRSQLKEALDRIEAAVASLR